MEIPQLPEGFLIIDMFSLIFLIIIGVVATALIFLIIIIKMGPQARRLGKANILKRTTAIIASEAGTLDIKVGKATSSGHLEVTRTECYELLQMKDSPELNRKFFWKRTGVPVSIGAGRKSVVVSPNALLATEIVDLPQEKKTEIPTEFREWLKGYSVSYTTTEDRKSRKDGKIKKVRKQITKTLLELNPLILLKYLKESMDTDAQDVLLDKKYQQGIKDAGKQWMKMGLIIGVCAMVGLMLLGIILISGGV